MNAIGIELGLRECRVAQIDDIGRPTIVANRDGQNTTPSVVEFRDNDVVEVGEQARKRLFIANNVVGRFMREMGTSKTYEVNGKSYTPTELSAFVLKTMRQDAEAALGRIDSAVVTVPANFTNEARDATIAAAKAAGLNIKHIVNEPTAAALYYAFKSGEELSGTYAVYDLGRGTFDISIIRVEGQDIEVLAANGIANCGGDDFDRTLHKLIKEKYKAATGEELDEKSFSIYDAEEEKKSLSKREKVFVRVVCQNIEITRSEFEEAILSLISQARLATESTVEGADASVNDLAGVFLVGGSTRIPAVQQSVRNIFGKDPISTANVDEVVALGAAVYAAYKGDRSKLNSIQRKTIEQIEVDERTAMCAGVFSRDAVVIFEGESTSNSKNMEINDFARLVLGEIDSEPIRNTVIIQKSQEIPCKATFALRTTQDNQTRVHLAITESRSPERDPTFVNVIQEGYLKLPPGQPAGQEIKVTLSFDENQLMNCTFVDVASGRIENFALSPTQKNESIDSDIDKFTVE